MAASSFAVPEENVVPIGLDVNIIHNKAANAANAFSKGSHETG
jgi:hypothetical protein